MAGSTRTVELKYKADLDHLLKNLAKIPEVTDKEAKAMVKALDKNLVKAEKAAKRAAKNSAKEMNKLTKSMDDVTDQAGEADSALKGVAGALELVHPEAGRVLSVVGELGGGLEGLLRVVKGAGPTMLAIAAAAALIGAAYKEWKEEQDRLERIQDASAATMELLAARTITLRDRTIALKVAVGELTAQEAELLRMRRANMIAAMPALTQVTSAITEQGTAISELRDKLQTANEAAALSGAAQGAMGVGAANATFKVQKLEAALAEEEDRLGSLEKRRTEVIASIKKQVAVEADLIKVKQIGTSVDKNRAQLQDKEKEHASAIRDLASIRKQMNADTLTAQDRINERYNDQIERLDAISTKLGETAEVEAARGEAEEAQTRALIDLRDDSAAKVRTLNKTAHAERMTQIAKERDAMTTGLAQGLGGLSSLVETLAEQQAEATGEANTRLFMMAKVAALGEIAINTAVSITKATRDLGPVAGGIAAGALLAMGAAQAAIVAAQEPPTFHMGGLIGGGSDSQTISALRGEAVLTRQAVSRIGEGGVNALNRGESPGGGVVVLNAYKHFDRFARDETRRGGQLRRAIKGNSRVGAKGF